MNYYRKVKRMNKHIVDVCKIGQTDECCRYLTCSVKGFICAKLDPKLKEILDFKIELGLMVAKSDNCEGKKDLNGD